MSFSCSGLLNNDDQMRFINEGALLGWVACNAVGAFTAGSSILVGSIITPLASSSLIR